jgi:tetratricopeptide (TPR) repeat protein
MLVVWGERYRRYFCDYCLPSLLAPNNIPSISNKRESMFAIATTAEDWGELSKHAAFKLLESHIRPVFLELPAFRAEDPKMMVMSTGHKRLSNHAFENRCFGVNINPDSIYSDYTVSALQDSARRGVKMVLYPGIRFEFEGVVDELTRLGFMNDTATISVPPRVAAGIGIRNPHPFTIACNWDNECFFEYPVYHYVADRANCVMIAHTISMGPIMLDYGAIDTHRDEIFEKWTLDGDYAYSNFGHFDIYSELEYVDDSDRFMVLGFTPKTEDVPKPIPVPGARLFRNFVKGSYLWRVYSDPVADPLKKRLYLDQVFFHEHQLGRASKRVARRDRRIIESKLLCLINDKDILAFYARQRGKTVLSAPMYSISSRSIRGLRLLNFYLTQKFPSLTLYVVLQIHSATFDLLQRIRSLSLYILQRIRSLSLYVLQRIRSLSLYLVQSIRLIGSYLLVIRFKSVAFSRWLLLGELGTWEAYQKRALRCEAAGDHVRAAQDLAKAIRMAPPNPALHYQRGLALLHAADGQGATSEFEAALKLDPANVTLRRLLGTYREVWEEHQERGSEREAAGDHLGAAEEFAHAIRMAPPNPALHFQRGVALFNAGEHVGAVAEFEAGLKLEPGNATLRSLLAAHRDGWVASQQRGIEREAAGDHLGAAEDFAKAIRMAPPNPALHFQRGVALLNAGEYVGAVAEFEAGLKLEPDNATLRSLLASHQWVASQERGIQREAAGDHLAAAEEFAQAIRMAPPNPALHYLRGLALLHAGDRLGAVTEFEAGLKLDPENPTLGALLDQTRRDLRASVRTKMARRIKRLQVLKRFPYGKSR